MIIPLLPQSLSGMVSHRECGCGAVCAHCGSAAVLSSHHDFWDYSQPEPHIELVELFKCGCCSASTMRRTSAQTSSYYNELLAGGGNEGSPEGWDRGFGIDPQNKSINLNPGNRGSEFSSRA